jgi:alkylation response protein AidB-like acyl-CoA dehydrogenase
MSPRRHALVGAVSQLQPLIRAERDWAEEHVRMSPSVMSALGAAGVFRMAVPVALGGPEASPSVQLEVLYELGAADPAAAWVVANGGFLGFVCAAVAEDAAKELLSDPDVFLGLGLVPTGKAVPDGDGFVVSGRWPVVSGCEHAAWLALNSVVGEADGAAAPVGVPDVRFMVVPAGLASIDRTWDTTGMRGTGSHAVELHEVRVPARLAMRIPDVARNPGLLYQAPFFPWALVAHAAIVVGIARSAVDHLIELYTTRVGLLDPQPVRETVQAQRTVSELDAAERMLIAGLRDGLASMWDELETSGEVRPATRAHLLGLSFAGFDGARDIVSRAFAAARVDALRRNSVFDRALRDAHVLCVQADRYAGLKLQAGRALLGLGTTDPRF